MKKAFTLLEINLAILAMAGGILSVVVLYTLGYRENRQNQEDLVAAAYADAVLGPAIGAISATDVKWNTFKNIKTTPAEGWKSYLDANGNVKENYEAASLLKSKFGAKIAAPSKCKYGLVVCHEEDSAVIRIGFRASRNLQSLLTAPLYYTEVRFQGEQE